MQEQQIWRLIAGRLTGEDSITERLTLNKYLRANRRLSDTVDVLSCIWQLPIEADEDMPELAFDKIMKRIHKAQ